MPTAMATIMGVPSPSMPTAKHATGSFTFSRGSGGATAWRRRAPIRWGSCTNRYRRPRSPASRLQGVGRCTDVAVAGHVVDHLAQGVERGPVAVQQLERLAVVGADADLERGPRR